jgi:catechol 2,3-dioxygenase-like lactoylglutathione lyase family enzyme
MQRRGRPHHIGLTVADLERSIDFYVTWLGFEPPQRVGSVAGDWISQVTGFPDTSLRIAFLTNGSMLLELLEYVSPKGRQSMDATTADVGSAHIAVEVADIEAHFTDMTAASVEFMSPPQLITSGAWQGRKIVYLRDPDGAVVELIQTAESVER